MQHRVQILPKILLYQGPENIPYSFDMQFLSRLKKAIFTYI